MSADTGTVVSGLAWYLPSSIPNTLEANVSGRTLSWKMPSSVGAVTLKSVSFETPASISER